MARNYIRLGIKQKTNTFVHLNIYNNTKMGQVIININTYDGNCESSVKIKNGIINDLTITNSELDLIKMQILTEINKQRKRKVNEQ